MTSALLALLLVASPAAPLNTAGFKRYQAGDYDGALEKFKAAVAADEQHALSHYNLAATLALLRSKGRTCDVEAYQGVILDHLEAAVRLDPKRLARAKVDTDFTSVRDTIRYQLLVGRSPTKPAGAKAWLTAITYVTPAQGAYGNAHTLKLAADGTFTLSSVELADDGDVKQVSRSGKWTLQGLKVTLTPDKPLLKQKQLTGSLESNGHLVFPAVELDFGDARSECDA